MEAVEPKRWRVKRQAGNPQEGPRGSPSSTPTAHSALLSDTFIDLSSRYGHRLVVLLSTSLYALLCLQTKGDAVSLALLFFSYLPF